MIETMNQFVIYLALVIFGLCFGSFAGASVWRLRARQLMQDKAIGDDVDTSEYKKLKKLTKQSLINDRSQCLNCNYILKWYDLIPVISWLSLAGKCRKCHKSIGYFELIIELGVALFFVISLYFWPQPLNNNLEIMKLIIWLVSGVSLAILFAYDMKWSLLPDSVNFMFIGLGVINSIIVIIMSNDKMATMAGLLGSILILSGLYLIIYIISRGMWIGFGDIKLGLGLALMLADWKLAFIALFLANIIGCLIVIPAMAVGKLKRNSHIPFGPLLIVGFVIAGLFGNKLIYYILL